MVKTRCSSGPRPTESQRLTDDEVVQDFVDPGNASRQAANVEIGAVLQHPFQADAVRESGG